MLYSIPFRVGIGKASQLVFDESTRISLLPVYGGEFLKMAPRLLILDAGGNLVTSDSQSGVAISIIANPSNGTLSTSSVQFIAVRGVISTSSLSVDKVGVGYRLNFNLLQYSSAHGVLQASAINLQSEAFNVLLGPARKLYNRVYAYDAIAGGQPFRVQPVIELHDYGDNVVTQSSAVTVEASMIPSLALTALVRVDAVNANVVSNRIITVSVNRSSGIYGAGELLIFTVVFRYDVTLASSGSGRVPYLGLTLFNATGASVRASLVTIPSLTQTIRFQYRIQPGDYTAPSTLLDYSGIHAIGDGTGLFTLNTTTVLDLPIGGISSQANITIITDSPRTFYTHILI